jgi:hypothetical protein
MSRVLGIASKKDQILIAIADNGAVVNDADHDRIQVARGQDDAGRLLAFMDDVKRQLVEVHPDRVRILKPEGNHTPGYDESAPKLALETIVRLCCAQADIPVDVLARATARARLDIDRRGSFDKHLPAAIGEPVGRYWSQGRNLAAAAALADES